VSERTDSFFEEAEGPSRDPEFDDPFPRSQTLPWDEGFGVSVIQDLMLAASSKGAVLLRSLIAYPRGFRFVVEAQLRQPLKDGPGARGHNAVSFGGRVIPGRELGSGLVQVGLRTSDGECYTVNRRQDQPSALLQLRSSGRGSSGMGEYFFGLPTGDIKLWVVWPAAGIDEASQVLDGDAIREAGGRAEPLWEDT
jgi:hypothetical protein